jgi:bifunctional ADP-heptose synthase (sugar kinase/adenylyltransferase)
VDTRTKIQDLEAAAATAAALRSGGEKVRLIAGSFDLLQAAHARDLQPAPAAALFVAVVNGEQPVLTLRARSELVAALAAVRCVIPVEGDLEGVIAAVQPDEFVNRIENHRAQFRLLVEHVRRRQAG